MEPDSNRRNNWFNQNVEIPVTEPGAYLVAMGTDLYEWTTLVFVSKLALATKCDGRVLLAYAANNQGGKPAGPCEVVVLENNETIHKDATNANGLFAGRIQGQPQSALVVARRGEDVAVSNVRYYGGNRYNQRGQVYVYSDRPVYRPEQTAHFKLVLRRYDFETNAFTFEPGEQLNVVVRDPKWNEIAKQTLEVNEFGTASFDLPFAAEPPLGFYRLQIGGTNAYGYYTFSVEEYKKPAYEVQVDFGKEHAVIGDTVEVRVGARYYFGEQVKHAKITYEVTAQPRWAYSPICGGPVYRRWAWFAEDYLAPYRGHRRHSGQQLTRGEGQINEDGSFTFSVDTAKLDELARKHRKAYPYHYGNTMTYNLSVRAVVTDKSRRGITGYGTLPVGASGVQVRVRPDRYSYRPGETVTVNVQATDLAGTPVETEVTCALKVRVRGDKEYREEETHEVTTDANGRGAFTFEAETNGYYRIEAGATDRAGRAATASAHVWIAARGWRSPYSYSGLEIKTDQDLYQPGDTAQVLVTTGHTDHMVLNTVEANHIEAWRLEAFSGSLCTFDLTIEKTFAPTANLTALVFANHTMVQQSRPIVVPPADKWLTATIKPDQKQYKPGQEATYTLTLTDHQGKPVQAELSIALVDEAIYAIQKDRAQDIRKFFYGRRRRSIYAQNSYNFRARGLGGAAAQAQREQRRKLGNAADARPSATMEAESAEGLAADRSRTAATAKGRGGGGPLKQARVRKDFADSAVWQAFVKTDAQGKATIRFTMPDNLTTWRAKVVALTRKGLVGQATQKTVTRQNLMVRLECPRTFTERDQATVSAIVHNYLKGAKRCVVRLKHDGGRLLKGASERELLVPTGEDQRVDWRLAIETHEPVQLTVSALTDEESDAMQKTIPVIPHGLELVAAKAGSTAKAETVSIALPQNADPARATLTVDLAPSLAASMMDGLEYLAGFPYGCVEQTMSRFLPTVYVQHAVDGLELQNDELRQKLPQYVDKGLQRLYGFQQNDGGWGWWKRDQSDPYMSAYVIYGLAQAKAAGYAVSDRALNRGLAFLAKALAGKIQRKHAPDQADEHLDTRAFVVHAYSQARKPEQGWVDKLYAARGELSDYALALVSQTALTTGDKARAEALAKELAGRATTTGTSASWGGTTPDHGRWQTNRIQATAHALKALVAVDPDHALVPKAVNWLVNQRRGGYWRSTKDTAAAVFALADTMQATGELAPDFQATLLLNGTPVKTVRFQGDALSLAPDTLTVAADGLQPGANTLAFEKKGKGRLYYACDLRSWSRGEDIPAVEQGLAVTREFLRLVPKADGTGYDREPIQGPVKSGTEIEVRLTVRPDAGQRYFMLEDYFPAGCEVVEDKSDLAGVYGGIYRHWWGYCANREARDERMVFFNSWLGEDERVYVYTLRAETPGVYGVMPTQGSLMYQPEVRGSCTKQTLVIED